MCRNCVKISVKSINVIGSYLFLFTSGLIHLVPNVQCKVSGMADYKEFKLFCSKHHHEITSLLGVSLFQITELLI